MKIDIFIIGAGAPYAGNIPSLLQKYSKNKTIIDWQIDSFKGIKNSTLNILGGYKINDVIRSYPKINYIFVKNWEKESILNTVFSIPKVDNDILFTYSDTIFMEEAITKIKQTKADVAIGIDIHYKKRFEKRSVEDANKAELIKFIDKDMSIKTAEFTGLVYFKKKIAKKILNYKKKKIGKKFLDFINHLKKENLNIEYIDLSYKWAELNEPQDLTSFLVGNKSKTLQRLYPMVNKTKIGFQISFNVKEWYCNKKNILKLISKKFKNKNLIVRSSSSNEDKINQSLAGKFVSVPNVSSVDKKKLNQAINKVISSYGQKKDVNNDYIFLQEYIKKNLICSGVVFTCDLDTGAPYYKINFDQSSNNTDLITSGKSKNDRVIILSKRDINKIKKYKPKLINLIKGVQEIENLLSFDKLDIEFAIDAKGTIHIFQVRPITIDHRKFDEDIENFDQIIRNTQKNYSDYSLKKLRIEEKKSFFSNMSDWNPAEMIGKRPSPLSFSLYKELISDEIWAKQRKEFGYKDLGKYPLITSFFGQPYVDIRASIKSFIPHKINASLSKKIVNNYLKILENKPQHHDKLEFKVVLTSWTPTLKNDLKKRFNNKYFSSKELNYYENELKKITKYQILNYEKSILPVNKLIKNFNNLSSKIIPPLKKANKLIQDCKAHGTLTFAHASRHGFIASNFLKSFIKLGIFSENDYEKFMTSLHTISKELQNDLIRYSKNNVDLKKLIKTYGHLRPGTYDNLNQAYWENPNYYFKSNKKKEVTKVEFKLNLKQEFKILKILQKLQLKISVNQFLDYIKRSIIMREQIKFEFTKNVSLALDNYNKFGKKNNLNKKDISNIKFKEFLKIQNKKLNLKKIKNIINKREKERAQNEIFVLPAFIKTKDDFLCFEEDNAHPNFVTKNIIISEIKFLNEKKNFKDIKKSIIVIDHADPGYDWIFNHQIKGLITKYGGANSHMAIRSAELNLPAAIGVGEKLYNNLRHNDKIKLDCKNGLISFIN
jgi:choline kinase/phosphohistidine swiveling domain-containing protein